MFNSLKYAKMLEEVGVSRLQAETQIGIMVEMLETNLATRDDMKELRQELKDFSIRVTHDLQQLEYRMTIKLGSMMAIAIGLMAVISKFS